ncbi:MAG: aldo/keto reductase [Candidatus Poribacteria bacterium]
MNYRVFGKTGWHISEISLGGAYLAGQDKDRSQENATSVVSRAIELGINYIDTAPYYGRSEELIGNALNGVDHSCYIATKFGLSPSDFDYKSDSVIKSIEQSLSRLRVPKLSLVQVHEVNVPGWDKIMATGYALTGLREAQKRGLCEKIGITGRAIPILAELAQTGEFDSILVYGDYHPASKLASEMIIPVATKYNMGIVIATVLANGLFTDKNVAQSLARLSGDEYARAKNIVDRLKQEPNTLAQSAFRYVLADKRISTIACGASNIAEIEEAALASDMNYLAHESLVLE